MTALIAMATFALVMSITPGPVNIIALSSGLNHGLRRTLPYVTGATVGFTALLFLIGLGAYQLFQLLPQLMTVMQYGGTAYLLWMAYGIATDKGSIDPTEAKVPSFWNGGLLQWLNPKAWIACLSGVSAFSLAEDFQGLLLFCALYFVICYLGVGFWAITGAKGAALVKGETALIWLNRIMGLGLGAIALHLMLSQ